MIHEKNYRNPIFRLYQTKHLLMLAFMKQASLLENENGYIARPSPKIIDAYFEQATELFMWAACLSNPTIIANLPHYKVSRQNEDMANLPDYLDLLSETKQSIGTRYRSISDENKLASWEQGIMLLNKRRNVFNINESTSGNPIAAKWALMITRAPKDVYPFWYAILSSKSVNIITGGVMVDGKKENVTAGDLREIRDWLEDNLLGPRGEVKTNHADDREPYFVARQVALNIIRRHIAVVEQGTTFYKIVNTATGTNILYASDDELEKQALAAGLDPKPEIIGKSKIEGIKAMAAWRTTTKQTLLELQPKPANTGSNKGKGSDYEIL
jgi:hypothetical protein